MRDGALQRPLWRALELLARVAGPVRARALAAAFMRLGARTERGYAKGLFRVASRLPEPMPRLWRVPPGWWSVQPRVRARRLGLDLELDLRDNLQRTLWFTGTYEPGLLRALHDELRPGDVVGAGLGEADGTIELRGDPRYGSADAGVRSQFGEGEVVATAPLLAFDGWAERNRLDRLDLVKIDIEG